MVSGPQSRSLSPIVISSGEDDRSFSTTVTVKKEGAAGGTQAKDGQSASATNQQVCIAQPPIRDTPKEGKPPNNGQSNCL